MHATGPEGSTDSVGTLEPFIDQIPDYALYMLDPRGHVRSWNAGAERLKKYAAKEILGRHFSVFYTAEDVALDKPRRVLEIAASAGAYQEEGFRVRKDGARFWAAVTITALRDKGGNLLGFVKLTHDLTARNAHETSVRTAQDAKCRALYENSNDAVCLTRPMDGAVLVANPAACRLFGYTEHELCSMHRDRLLDTSDPKFVEAWKERAEVGAVAAELTFVRKGGVRFEARVSSRLFVDENGRELACSSIHDITDRKQTEDALRQSEERFRLVFENAPIGIIQVDEHGRLTSANKKFLEIVGYSREEIIGLAHPDTTPPEDRAFADEIGRKLLSGELDSIQVENSLQRKDGTSIWVRVNVRMMPQPKSDARKAIALYEDITEAKWIEDALRQSEKRFRTTFENAPIGIAECAINGKFLSVNSKLVEILGYSEEELASLTVMGVTHPADVEESLAGFHRLATGELESFAAEKRYLRKDRSIVWVNVTATISPGPEKLDRLIVAVEDVSARKRAEEDLKRAIEVSYHQANHDMLTGLANRAAFNDRLKEALAYAKRDQHLVAIHMLDLDGFKAVNDTLGHHIGDLLLREVAERIGAQVRGSDLAARLGGDEFVVIQTLLAEPSGAGILAARLHEELARPYVLEGRQVISGACIGIALYPDDSETPEELMKHADLALYDAKNRGRFNYQFYRKELGAAFHKTQQMERELVAALRGKEFVLHYQPQFDAKCGRISGIEALLRWRHPTRGTLTAAAFIQEAERARLMPVIGEWTFQTACRQYKEWIDAGLGVPLTLNLSLMQLRDPRFLQSLKSTLAEAGMPASSLQLEMRENLLWDPKFSANLLMQMKESGLRLALDEVGAELTTLPTLDRFPLDAVKPGQRLVRKLASQEREATILAAIIGVAHNLEIAVCADGIETAAQLDVAREQGFDSVQGNLLSAPLNVDEMNRLIGRELVH